MNFKLQEAREKIELQVSQARLKVKEAARKMEVAEKNQVKADENLKYANLGFQEGTDPGIQCVGSPNGLVGCSYRFDRYTDRNEIV